MEKWGAMVLKHYRNKTTKPDRNRVPQGQYNPPPPQNGLVQK